MNILLWIAQGLLALLSFLGGAFKVFKFDEVASTAFYSALPRAGWAWLGAFEMACGVLLAIPVAIHGFVAATPVAAGALSLECLALAALYGRHSTRLTASNPLVWSAAMGVVALFVAYGRYALRPLA